MYLSYCIVFIVSHCIVFIIYYIILYYIILYYIILYYIILYYIILYYNSNNDRHPVTNTFNPLHSFCRHFTSSDLNFTQKKHHYPLIWLNHHLNFPPLHFTSLHYTSPHFTTLHFQTIFATLLFLPLHPVYNCFPKFLSKYFAVFQDCKMQNSKLYIFYVNNTMYFLQLIHQSTNILNKVQLITSIKYIIHIKYVIQILFHHIYLKVQQPHYRPGVAQRVPGS